MSRRPRFARASRHFLPLAIALAVHAAPIGAQPVVGSDTPVTSLEYVPSPAPWLTLATDGSGFLTTRRSQNGSLDYGLLDGEGAAVGAQRTLDLYGGRPAAAFDGTNYRMVWLTTASGYRVMTRRIAPSGATLGTAAVTVMPSNVIHPPALACATGRCLIAGVRNAAGTVPSAILLSRVEGDALLDTSPIALTAPDGEQYSAPVVSADDQGYLVAWVRSRIVSGGSVYLGIQARRITRDGALVGTAPIDVAMSPSPGVAMEPGLAVAFDGVQHVVVWNLDRVSAVRIAVNGTAIDTAPVVLDTAPPAPVGTRTQSSFLMPVSIARREDHLAVGWMALYRLSNNSLVASHSVRTFDRALAARTPTRPLGPAGSFGQAIAASATRTLVAYGEQQGSETFTRGVFLVGTDAATSTPAIPISYSHARIVSPVLAPGGTGWTGAWISQALDGSNTARSMRLSLLRLDAQGRALDPSPAIVASEPALLAPMVASTNASTLVAWLRPAAVGAELFARRYGLDGMVIDPVATPLATGVDSAVMPVMAAGPDGWLIAWRRASGTAGQRLTAMYIASDGTAAPITATLSEDVPLPALSLTYSAEAGAFFLASGSASIRTLVRIDGTTRVVTAQTIPAGIRNIPSVTTGGGMLVVSGIAPTFDLAAYRFDARTDPVTLLPPGTPSVLQYVTSSTVNAIVPVQWGFAAFHHSAGSFRAMRAQAFNGNGVVTAPAELYDTSPESTLDVAVAGRAGGHALTLYVRTEFTTGVGSRLATRTVDWPLAPYDPDAAVFIDASTDAASDVPGDSAVDAGTDGRMDAVVDAQTDAPIDASPDIGADVAMDVTVDVPRDSATDVTVDGASDAAGDARADAMRADAGTMTSMDGCGCSTPGLPGSSGHGAGFVGLAVAATIGSRRRRRQGAGRTG